jgi:hypothetical protein
MLPTQDVTRSRVVFVVPWAIRWSPGEQKSSALTTAARSHRLKVSSVVGGRIGLATEE